MTPSDSTDGKYTRRRQYGDGMQRGLLHVLYTDGYYAVAPFVHQLGTLALRHLHSMFRSKQAAPVSEHAKLRSLQISEFLKANPAAQLVQTAIPNDPTTTYTIQIQTGTAGPLTMHIVLGPLFPERPPACQLTTNAASLRLMHRYLDAGGFLSLHPKLQSGSWTPHSNLGLLIQGLINEIVQQPPQLVGGQAPAFSAASQPAASPASYNSYNSNPAQPQGYSPAPQYSSSPVPSPMSQNGVGMPSPAQQATRPPGIPAPAPASSVSASVSRTRPPDVPTQFPQLDSMSISDLEDVLAGGDDAVRDLAAEADALQQILRVAQELSVKLTDKARENLAARTQLEALTTQLASESARLKETQQHNTSLLHRQQHAQSRFTLPVLLRELDTAIASADEESEASKERFEQINQKAAAAGSTVEEQGLLEVFIRQRMTMHERAAKKERLTETYGRQ